MDHNPDAERDRRTLVMLRSHTERCLQDIWGTSRLRTDADEDYPYRHGTAMCWVSVQQGPEPGLRVFAHAALGLKRSARLLTELNELNTSSRWARVGLVDGIALVSAELHWSAVDRLALAHAVRAVGQVADDVGTLLATVYGGDTPFPADEPQQDRAEDEAS